MISEKEDFVLKGHSMPALQSKAGISKPVGNASLPCLPSTDVLRSNAQDLGPNIDMTPYHGTCQAQASGRTAAWHKAHVVWG